MAGDQLLARLPGTAVTTLNPGFFADNDMAGLPFAAQFGLLMLPYGAGRNAPPSNEDVARVAAEILARPAGHAGYTYRPTGPALLSPQHLAGILARVLGHRVTYVDVPFPVFARVARGVGLSDFGIAQYEQIDQDTTGTPSRSVDLRRGAARHRRPPRISRPLPGATSPWSRRAPAAPPPSSGYWGS